MLLSLVSIGADVAPPTCDDETEALVEVNGDDSSAYITIYKSTNHDSYGRLSQDLFSSFVESENGTWQGCLPVDACFVAVVLPLGESMEEDAITFKYNERPSRQSSLFRRDPKSQLCL